MGWQMLKEVHANEVGMPLLLKGMFYIGAFNMTAVNLLLVLICWGSFVANHVKKGGDGTAAAQPVPLRRTNSGMIAHMPIAAVMSTEQSLTSLFVTGKMVGMAHRAK